LQAARRIQKEADWLQVKEKELPAHHKKIKTVKEGAGREEREQDTDRRHVNIDFLQSVPLTKKKKPPPPPTPPPKPKKNQTCGKKRLHSHYSTSFLPRGSKEKTAHNLLAGVESQY